MEASLDLPGRGEPRPAPRRRSWRSRVCADGPPQVQGQTLQQVRGRGLQHPEALSVTQAAPKPRHHSPGRPPTFPSVLPPTPGAGLPTGSLSCRDTQAHPGGAPRCRRWTPPQPTVLLFTQGMSRADPKARVPWGQGEGGVQHPVPEAGAAGCGDACSRPRTAGESLWGGEASSAARDPVDPRVADGGPRGGYMCRELGGEQDHQAPVPPVVCLSVLGSQIYRLCLSVSSCLTWLPALLPVASAPLCLPVCPAASHSPQLLRLLRLPSQLCVLAVPGVAGGSSTLGVPGVRKPRGC